MKKSKKGVLGGPTDKRSTEKARGVRASAKVGKGEPPKAFKWQPGQSGNPSGKPSAHREVIVQAVKDMLAQVDPKLNKSLFERLLEQCARRALQGSKWHMGVLLDYGLGKPKQAMDVDLVNYTDALTRMRSARQLEQADATIWKYFHELPGNGHSTPAEAQAAALLPDDAEQPAQPQPKITVEL